MATLSWPWPWPTAACDAENKTILKSDHFAEALVGARMSLLHEVDQSASSEQSAEPLFCPFAGESFCHGCDAEGPGQKCSRKIGHATVASDTREVAWAIGMVFWRKANRMDSNALTCLELSELKLGRSEYCVRTCASVRKNMVVLAILVLEWPSSRPPGYMSTEGQVEEWEWEEVWYLLDYSSPTSARYNLASTFHAKLPCTTHVLLEFQLSSKWGCVGISSNTDSPRGISSLRIVSQQSRLLDRLSGLRCKMTIFKNLAEWIRLLCNALIRPSEDKVCLCPLSTRNSNLSGPEERDGSWTLLTNQHSNCKSLHAGTQDPRQLRCYLRPVVIERTRSCRSLSSELRDARCGN